MVKIVGNQEWIRAHRLASALAMTGPHKSKQDDEAAFRKHLSKNAVLYCGTVVDGSDLKKLKLQPNVGQPITIDIRDWKLTQPLSGAFRVWAKFPPKTEPAGMPKGVLALPRQKPQSIAMGGVLGLGEILFPTKDGMWPIPNDEGAEADENVTPRLVVVKGPAGTGKTTLAVQLMIAMARQDVRCLYLCTNDGPPAIKHTALSYEFCTRRELDEFTKRKRIELKNAFLKQEEYVRDLENLTQDYEYADTFCADAVFVDSLDPHRLSEPECQAKPGVLREILSKLKTQPRLSFIVLEDSKSTTDPVALGHIADCEHMADILIELGNSSTEGYHINALQVDKRHFGSHVRGRHEYKLLSKDHPLSNIDPVRGFATYPSLHYYLSRARIDTYTRKGDFVHTGIAHLDSILSSERTLGVLDGRIVPRNSCFVIQGHRSPYDMAVGTNILLGGLWSPDPTSPPGRPAVVKDGDVLIVSLSEETNLDLGREAIAFRTEHCTRSTFSTHFDNGHWLRWRRHDGSVAHDGFTQLIARCGAKTTSRQVWDALGEAGLIDEIGQVDETVDTASSVRILKKITGALSPLGISAGPADPLPRGIYSQLISTLHGEEHYQLPGGSHRASRYLPQCPHYKLFEKYKNIGKKVVFNKWCAHLLNHDGSVSGKCGKVVIAVFRPGCITPEECLRTLELLLAGGAFSRVMFTSTALLAGRFPLLAASNLFVPSLIDLFKSRNMLSIILDPQFDKRHVSSLSVSLSSLADFLVELRPCASGKPAIESPTVVADGKQEESLADTLQNGSDECPWNDLIVHNVRGKNYTRAVHRVTARPTVHSPLYSPGHRLIANMLADGIAQSTIDLLRDGGFLAQAADPTRVTELVYMRKEDFLKVVGLGVASGKSDLLADLAKAWSWLTRYRPSTGNELHLVNVGGDELELPAGVGTSEAASPAPRTASPENGPA